MAIDPADEISDLSSKLVSIEAVLDPDTMRKEADELRERSADPALWEDQENAQAVTRRLSYLDAELTRLAGRRRWRNSPRSAPRSTSSRSGRCFRVSTTRATR